MKTISRKYLGISLSSAAVTPARAPSTLAAVNASTKGCCACRSLISLTAVSDCSDDLDTAWDGFEVALAGPQDPRAGSPAARRSPATPK